MTATDMSVLCGTTAKLMDENSELSSESEVLPRTVNENFISGYSKRRGEELDGILHCTFPPRLIFTPRVRESVLFGGQL